MCIRDSRVDHLSKLRRLQDQTGGFTGFVPFAFEPQTTILAHIKAASAIEQLRNLAVSRIYLDNIDHLTAYWVSLGSVSYTHLRAHETGRNLVCRLLLEKK